MTERMLFGILVLGIYLEFGACDLVLPYPYVLCPMSYAMAIVLYIPQTLLLRCPRSLRGWHKP